MDKKIYDKLCSEISLAITMNGFSPSYANSEKVRLAMLNLFLAGCHAQAEKDRGIVEWIKKNNTAPGVGKICDEILIDMESAEIKEGK